MYRSAMPKPKEESLGLNAWRALRSVWQSAPGWTVVSAIVLLAQAILPLLALYLMKLLVDVVSAGITAANREAAFSKVVFFIALSGAVMLVSSVCASIARLASQAQAQSVTDHMYDVIHAKSIELDLSYYEDSQYHDTLHRAIQQASYRPTRFMTGLVQVGQSAVALVGVGLLLVSFHWAVGLILIAAAIPSALVRSRFARRMYAWQRQRTPMDRLAKYYSWLLNSDLIAKEIRLYHLGSLFLRRCHDLRAQLRREQIRLIMRRSSAETAAEVCSIVAVYALYLYVGYRTVQGVFTLGDLVLYYQAVQRAQSLLGQTLTGLSDLYESNLFLVSLYEFLDLKPKLVEPSHPRAVRRPIESGIVFDHVSFEYPHSSRKALDEVTLTIRPGEHVAFVGENGAGKSTLIKLLCRLYDPTDGAIYLDGHDIRDYASGALRSEISVVFQDHAHYNFTARDNIWFGNINLPADSERIEAAARQAGADGVISRLPKRYDNFLGKWFPGGEGLSLGEWQKIALARAFLRDGQIIVLDEPTSAMDAKAEYELFQRFHELNKGRTAILISHRLSTVRMADRIYVLEHGRIAESGTHDDLIDRGGQYASLFERQAQSYR